ncbi:MAG: ATP-binding protein [Methylacidiphilales bacterium]|nr:ATP-binding protein [Candidatus Methylacidiphilales bacterium]
MVANRYYLSQQALQMYGFTNQPFQYTNTTKEIYFDPIIQSVVEKWVQQISAQEAFYLLTGAKGSGKSSFGKLIALHGSSKSELHTVFLTCSPVNTPIDFLSLLVEQSQFQSKDNVKQLTNKAAKETYQQLKNGILPIYILDNAHSLQTKVLVEIVKFCSSFTELGLTCPRLIMCGNVEDIKHKLEGHPAPLVVQNKFTVLSCPALDYSQMHSYLQFKFANAGIMNSTKLISMLPAERLMECRGNFQKLNEIVVGLLEDNLLTELPIANNEIKKQPKLTYLQQNKVSVISLVVLVIIGLLIQILLN